MTRKGHWHRRLTRANAHSASFLKSAASLPAPCVFVEGLDIGDADLVSLGNFFAGMTVSSGIVIAPRFLSFRWESLGTR